MISKRIVRVKKCRAKAWLKRNISGLKKAARRDERHHANQAVRCGLDCADTLKYRLTERDII